MWQRELKIHRFYSTHFLYQTKPSQALSFNRLGSTTQILILNIPLHATLASQAYGNFTENECIKIVCADLIPLTIFKQNLTQEKHKSIETGYKCEAGEIDTIKYYNIGKRLQALSFNGLEYTCTFWLVYSFCFFDECIEYFHC